jgi:ribosomal protein L18
MNQAVQHHESDARRSAARQRAALVALGREYDDLRVRLIVLKSAPNEDVQTIEDVADRLAAVRRVLKYR